MRTLYQKLRGMKFATLRTKLIVLCVLLVVLTTMTISVAFYTLTKLDKRRESLERIQIAFEIIADDFLNSTDSYLAKLSGYLAQDFNLPWVIRSYDQNPERFFTMSTTASYLSKVSTDLKKLAHAITADRLSVYANDKRLLISYTQNDDEEETIGAYMISATQKDTYLALDDFSTVSKMLVKKLPIPDVPLPSGVAAYYEGDFPENSSISLFREEGQLGFRTAIPVYRKEQLIGVFLGEFFFYTPDVAARYATLSNTKINFFAGNRFSAGTLPAQTHLDTNTLSSITLCEDVLNKQATIEITSATFGDDDYYQGQCAFRSPQETIGAITVSLSQDVEKRETRKILFTILIIAIVVGGVAIGVSLLYSRKPVQSIQQVIVAINQLSQGELPEKISGAHDGEFGDIIRALNTMVQHVKNIVAEVQSAADHVAAGSRELQDMAGGMTESTRVQAAATTETSASMTAMSANIQQSVNHVVQTEKIAAQSAQYAKESGTVVNKTVTAMQQVAKKIAIIQDIAAQTRMLSLNATIEASHVKEHGRAFSVVASEVRKLSDITKTAADDIDELVSSSVIVAEHAREMLEKLVPNIDQTADLMQEMSAAHREQNREIGQINEAIQRLDRATQQNAEMSEHISAASEQLSAQSEHLRNAMLFFTIASMSQKT